MAVGVVTPGKVDIDPKYRGYVERAWRDLYGGNWQAAREGAAGDENILKRIDDLAELYAQADRDEESAKAIKSGVGRTTSPVSPSVKETPPPTETPSPKGKTKERPLEVTYPTFKDDIQAYRKEGLDDNAINGKISDWVQSKIQEGHSVEDIQSYLGVGKARPKNPNEPEFGPGILDQVRKFGWGMMFGGPEKGRAYASGLARGLTLGYYDPIGMPIETDTAGAMFGDVAGQLTGQLAPGLPAGIGANIAVRAGTKALPGLRALARYQFGKNAAMGVQRAVEGTASGVIAAGGLGLAQSQPDNQLDIKKRVETGLEYAIDPLNVGMSVIGGAAHGRSTYKAMERAFEVKKAIRGAYSETE